MSQHRIVKVLCDVLADLDLMMEHPHLYVVSNQILFQRDCGITDVGCCSAYGCWMLLCLRMSDVALIADVGCCSDYGCRMC